MSVTMSHHRARRRPARVAPRHRDGGYVLAKFALLLVPLLLMTGLSVDVGYWYNRAADIQKAADAAALAGVVWLPDLPAAKQYALAAAAKNGFTDGVDDIEVEVVQAGDRRLRVSIQDKSVGSFFWANLGGSEIDMTREGLAEYVLPVPMGSPTNYFGLGSLTSTTIGSPLSSPELLYQSVNPSCTSKVNGDRHQSPHYDPLNGASLTSCSTTPTNTDYREQGYELYVEAPEGRTQSIEVLLYDPRYNGDGTNCTTTYPTSWTGPATSGSTNLTVTATGGFLQYQTRTSNTSTTWSSTVTIDEGEQVTYHRQRIRYKQGTTTCAEAGIDSERQSGVESFTYSLYAADNTPLSDSDNPLVSGCSKTYSKTSAFERTYLGSSRWNVLCTITTSMPTGRYILRVKNGAPGELTADGSNQWGLVAKYTGATGDGLCDSRTNTSCPRVYGRDAISVYANTSAGVASFFMAEIEGEHNGKTLELELWDPGEGGSKIEFLKPTGTNSWAATSFSWNSYNNNGSSHSSGSNVMSVSVLSSVFNGRLLRIRIPLTNYVPPSDNKWWKIRYTFDSGNVTDRTTWSAKVVGDPVHLLEEEAD